MRNKKVILSSILSLVLCLSLIAGGTFALFTSESKTNIAITSGKVEVVATIENLDVYSPESINEDGTIAVATDVATMTDANNGVFVNGGTAGINGSELKLTNMTPGDEVTFDIRIKNNSTVAVQYRTLLALSENTGLFEGLNVTVGDIPFVTDKRQTPWASMEVGSDDIIVPVKVVLPSTAGNEYQEKSAKLNFTVSAVQGNTNTSNIDPEEDTLLYDGANTVNIPAGILTAGQVAKLNIDKNATAPDNVATIDDTVISAMDISIVDADGNPIDMPTANYTVTMDIGKGLDATKLAIYHNDQKVEPISYNAGTGIVTFTTTSFSPFTAVLEGVGTIDSLEKLEAVRDSINAGDDKAGVEYYLTADIDLANGKWTAISNFAGTFDGQNYTVSNLTANLFGTVSGTVKNLNVKNVTVTNTTKGGANGFIGTLAEGGLVDNCDVSGVEIQWADGLTDMADCFGGIISRVNTGATVQNCEFTDITLTAYEYFKRSSPVFAEVGGTISGCIVDGVTLSVINDDKATGNAYTNQVGGIIADLYSSAEVIDCDFNNIVMTIDRANNTGGVIGKAYVTGTAGPCEITLKDITINNLTMNIGNTIYANKSISNVGGFIGQMDSRNNDSHLTMSNCHINGLDMTLASNKKGEDPSGGFIASLNGGADITNCSVDGKINGTNEPIGIGGFLGTIGGYGANNDYVINITDCAANVAITGNDNIFVGGFVAHAGSYNQTMTKNLALNFTNCEATGSFYGVKDTNETEVCTFTGCKVDGAAFNG